MEGVVMVDPSFWQGRRVLVTGHTGFKGAWLALWLQRMGAELTGYSLPPPTDPSLFDMARVADGMRSVVGDVRDGEAIATTIAEVQPEVVFHMAAQPLVRLSYADPVGTYATNVMGTVHVLEAVRAVGGVKAAIVVTSDKCYDNKEWAWGYREIDPLGGRDPYSSSKGCAELVASAYRLSFFHPESYARHRTAVATVRAGNVIGGGDWAADRLIPDLIRSFLVQESARIRNPGAIRPWQYVLEPLAGYLELAERMIENGPGFGGAWNFGPRPEDAQPVHWISTQLARWWGDGAAWHEDSVPDQPHEARYLQLDWSKAYRQLGWVPRWSLDEALRRCAEWYRGWQEHPTAASVRSLCDADIDAFSAGGAERHVAGFAPLA